MVRLKLGSAFDVVGERRQLDYKVDGRARWMEEVDRIMLRNHKDQPSKYRCANPCTAGATGRAGVRQPFHKDSAQLIHFDAVVPKDGTDCHPLPGALQLVVT